MDTLNPLELLNYGTTPVAIGAVQFDALLEITEKFDANVPMIRTDIGYETSDDIIPGFMSVDMRLFVTPTPVTWWSVASHRLRNPREVVDALNALLEKRKPVFVTTVKKNYDNMMIQKITTNKSADTGYALTIDVSMVQITVASYEEHEMHISTEFAPSTVVGQPLTVGASDGDAAYKYFKEDMGKSGSTR